MPLPGSPGRSGARADDAGDTSPGPRVMRLRVSLQDVMPEVWRRLEVPADMSLAELHAVIQAAMGWHDRHRFGFQRRGDAATAVGLESAPTDVRLEAVGEVGAALVYTYDPDDNWRHIVEIEAIGPAHPRARTPRCVAGGGACPPEDCGGLTGYAQLVRTLAGRMTDAKRALLAWLGEPFDPELFRVTDANARLAVFR
ncbi:hypothetical protein CFB82_40730 [Burkholderia sp. HI2714]|nr:hypothetical protein CFB82_40730 [Burkholderia sp. HI2714]